MKKRIITLILLIAILLVYVCFAVGCVLFSSGGLLEPISRPKYAEYFDENGKMYFRTVNGYTGFGYLMLNGKKVSAKFNISYYGDDYYGLLIQVMIPKEEDLRADTEITSKTYALDSFTVMDEEDNGSKVLYARKVILFGESIGKVTLSVNQLEKSDFQPWEYQLRWESKISEEWKILDFAGAVEMLNVHKCVTIYARKTEQDKTQACILRWLPDTKGFEIYLLENQSQFEPSAGQQPIATGGYVLQEEVVTLTFVTDGLFDGAYPTLELTLKN